MLRTSRLCCESWRRIKRSTESQQTTPRLDSSLQFRCPSCLLIIVANTLPLLSTWQVQHNTVMERYGCAELQCSSNMHTTPC
uniref:Uncharacterized protein n=1 Tax=Anguilla anguilla TaxID=7936 RepID=A0A0E9T3Z7_ANGAN